MPVACWRCFGSIPSINGADQGRILENRLIEQFYRSITAGTPVPIPYREILLTATIMDEVFAQLDVEQQPEGRRSHGPWGPPTHAGASMEDEGAVAGENIKKGRNARILGRARLASEALETID